MFLLNYDFLNLIAHWWTSELRTDNPKYFWSEIEKLGPRKKDSKIPMEVNIDGTIIYQIDEVLQHWHNQFRQLFAKQDIGAYDENFYRNAISMLNEWENELCPK